MKSLKFRSSPLVSWLLCTNVFDSLLCRAINSCLVQSFSDFELVIVVNGPERHSIYFQLCKLYSNYSNVRIFVSDLKYLTHSLNLGLDKSNGSYIARLDADDVAHPDRLKLQTDFMLANPDIDILSSSFQQIDALDNKYDTHVVVCSHGEISRTMHKRNPIPHPTVMFKRDAILSVGGYMGGVNAEDYDLWLRCLVSGCFFAGLPDVLTFYNIDISRPARRSRQAYAACAASLLRVFLVTFKFRFFFGCVLHISKLIFFTRRL